MLKKSTARCSFLTLVNNISANNLLTLHVEIYL